MPNRDQLFRKYLDREGATSVSVVTKEDCEKNHGRLEEELSRAIKEATGKSEAKLKLWILGSLIAIVVWGLAGYTCAVSEIGAYKERIDNTGRQVERQESSASKQFEELKIEIRQLRDLILGRRTGP